MSYIARKKTEDYAPMERMANGMNCVRWNKVEHEDGTCTFNEAVIEGKPTLDRIVTLIVRERYSESEELALARQSFARAEEFLEYNRYVEQCKKWACECMGEEYMPTYAPTLTEVLNQLKTLAKGSVEALPDEEAVNVPSLFPEWKPNVDEVVGSRRYYGEKLYKCIQPHRTQVGWEPEKTPALWIEVSIEEWPEWRQPLGSEDAYHIGDKVSHNSQHWISLVDGNVWEPSEATPTLWQLV